MNTTKLDAALIRYRRARQAAIEAGLPAALLDGSLVKDESDAARRYNRASRAVDRASQAAYATHIR